MLKSLVRNVADDARLEEEKPGFLVQVLSDMPAMKRVIENKAGVFAKLVEDPLPMKSGFSMQVLLDAVKQKLGKGK